MNDNLARRSVTVLVLLMALFYGSLLLFPESSGTVSNVFSVSGDLATLVILLLGIRRWPERRRLAWKLFAVSFALCLVGDVVWAVEEEVLGVDIEVPALPDVFYLFSTMACFFALFRYIRDEMTIDLATTGFDILISIVATAGIFYNYVMLRLENFQEMVFWRAAIMLSYPVTDVAYLMGFFTLVFGEERHCRLSVRNYLLAGGILLMFLADQSYLIQSIVGDVAGGLLDPVWSLSFGLIALASLRASEETAAEEESGDPLWLVYLRMLLPYFLTIVILVMVGTQYGLVTSPFFIGSVLLLALLSIRQLLVLFKNRRLLMVISENEKELHRKNAELQRLNKHFMTESETDFLTKLLNRRAVDQAFERLTPLDDEPETLGLLLIDVDYFKKVNDTFGHQRGDDVLVAVADTISATIRGSDIGGRFGGDEFIVLLPGANMGAAEVVARRLTEAAKRNKTLAETQVTLSIGGTSWSVGKRDYHAEELLQQADDALYRAKEAGRDCYRMFSEISENKAEQEK